jgi:lipopolysaccharide/colanic/teichoic acid biosynthesis glycosyltransferase
MGFKFYMNDNMNYTPTDKLIISQNMLFWPLKRLFDIIMSLLLMPIFLLLCVLLFLINPLYNKGSIFFVQTRMGKNCLPFRAIKFRSMSDIGNIIRKYDDPVETERITPLGKCLRISRLDELPQILNVLRGEMSLIGPRPDFYEHALYFVEHVEKYNLRHLIKPGLSGLSQIRLGYVEGIEATKDKTNIDIYYVENASFSLDVKIFFSTILIVLKCYGK